MDAQKKLEYFVEGCPRMRLDTSRGGLDTDKVRLKALDLPLLILTLFVAEKGRFISLVVTS